MYLKNVHINTRSMGQGSVGSSCSSAMGMQQRSVYSFSRTQEKRRMLGKRYNKLEITKIVLQFVLAFL